MLDSFAPPGDDLAGWERGQLPMVRYARTVLWLMAAMNGLLAVMMPVVYGFLPSLDPDMDPDLAPVMVGTGLCVGAFAVAIGVVPMIVAANGLSKGSKVGWILTVVIGAMYAPSACLPLGAFLLYAMLNNEVRNAFLS